MILLIVWNNCCIRATFVVSIDMSVGFLLCLYYVIANLSYIKGLARILLYLIIEHLYKLTGVPSE